MAPPQAWKQKTWQRLVTVAVLLSLCAAFFVSSNRTTEAAGNLLNVPTSKISPDLRQLLLSGNGDRRVKVIVQTKPSASPGLLGSLLNTVGGILVDVLSNLNIRIIDVTANTVE